MKAEKIIAKWVPEIQNPATQAWEAEPDEVKQAIARARASVSVYLSGLSDGYRTALDQASEDRPAEASRVAESLSLYPEDFRRSLLEKLSEQLNGAEPSPEPEKGAERTVK